MLKSDKIAEKPQNLPKMKEQEFLFFDGSKREQTLLVDQQEKPLIVPYFLSLKPQCEDCGSDGHRLSECTHRYEHFKGQRVSKDLYRGSSKLTTQSKEEFSKWLFEQSRRNDSHFQQEQERVQQRKESWENRPEMSQKEIKEQGLERKWD